MTEQDSTNYLDIVQTTAPTQKVQDFIETLLTYVNVNAIPEKEGCSWVECLPNESIVLKTLKEIWKEFKDDFNRTRTIVPSATSLPMGVRLLVFQGEKSHFYDLIDKDDWIVLIPIVTSGSAEAILHNYTTGRNTSIKVEPKMEIIIAGRCSMWLAPQCKVVCLVLCLGTGSKGIDKE